MSFCVNSKQGSGKSPLMGMSSRRLMGPLRLVMPSNRAMSFNDGGESFLSLLVVVFEMNGWDLARDG